MSLNIILPSNEGILRARDDYRHWITQARDAAENGRLQDMLDTLDKIPLVDMDKPAVMELGVALVGHILDGSADDNKIMGCLHLQNYFGPRNTLQTIPLYIKVLESDLPDRHVSTFLNAIDVSYDEVFQELISTAHSIHPIKRFDSLMKADLNTYLKLVSVYSELRYSWSDVYQLLAENISRLAIAEPPKYLMDSNTPLVHEELLSQLVDRRFQEYPLDLELIGVGITETNLDNNILFADDVDYDTEAFINQYKFLMMDPHSRKRACELINIEYPEDLLEDEIEDFRRFGPCNPVHNPINSQYDVVQQYMLTSFYNDNVDETGTEIYPDENISADQIEDLNWFTGMCDRCSRGIERLHHAVRRPVLYGGWTGCYCSWNCVRNSTDNVMSQVMADIFSAQLDEYGLYEREYRQPPQIKPDRTVDIINEIISTTLRELNEESEDYEDAVKKMDPQLVDYLMNEFQKGIREGAYNESITRVTSEASTIETNITDQLTEIEGGIVDVEGVDNLPPRRVARLLRRYGANEDDTPAYLLQGDATFTIRRPVFINDYSDCALSTGVDDDDELEDY